MTVVSRDLILIMAASDVAARLEAWADSAYITARSLSDAEAEPYRNQQQNYAALALQLRRAIATATGREP